MLICQSSYAGYQSLGTQEISLKEQKRGFHNGGGHERHKPQCLR
ncbi:unnamed protein product [Tetraodon nigroviridis]|uniref:Chromosome 7 SCAF14703, whole genome shotgun sequence n=1 Tax=Tetraodon nigroviridis TaxID=99883 RepID=Q4S8V5_TETNG|nr:unnamed protein product [Tetraodon nigroviridis]